MKSGRLESKLCLIRGVESFYAVTYVMDLFRFQFGVFSINPIFVKQDIDQKFESATTPTRLEELVNS